MRYKSYEGSVEFDEIDKVFHGRILHISDYVTFEATTAEEVEPNFQLAIDKYLKQCEVEEREPNSPVGKIMSFSQLPAMIEKIEGRIKHIPQTAENIPAMETVQVMLEVINAYAFWVEQFKKEFVKLDKLNKKQAEALKSRGIVNI